MSDEFLTCPYNPIHKIIHHRMPYHLVKCKKSYTGIPLETCPFNAMHLYPKEAKAEHLDSCQDYYIVMREKYEQQGLRH